jgi:hypothetical protein
MTTNLVDPSGHVGGKPLPAIDLAAMSKSHNHDQENLIGNAVDDAVVAYAHPIARATSQGSGCWRPRVVGEQPDYALDTGTNCRVEFPQ